MTVLELVKGSLRLIRVLGIGRGIAADGSIAADCVFALNALRDGWNTERMMIPRIAVDTYPLTGAESYQIGPDGDFDAPRPLRLEDAALIRGGARSGLRVLTREEWHRRVCGVYLDPTYPLATIRIEPAPESGASLEASVWRAIGEFTPDGGIELPDGYSRALLYNLALELAPMFPEAVVSPLVVETAREAKAAVKRLNAPRPEMDLDPTLLFYPGGGRLR